MAEESVLKTICRRVALLRRSSWTSIAARGDFRFCLFPRRILCWRGSACCWRLLSARELWWCLLRQR